MKVRLEAWTKPFVETIYVEWMLSRQAGPVPSAQQVALDIAGLPEDHPRVREVRQVFEDCVAMRVPISETLNLVWTLDEVPVSFREQAVRHRVGHRFGGQDFVGLIPALESSSFWAQSMRAVDVGEFASGERRGFHWPDSVTTGEQRQEYVQAMFDAERHYRNLVAMGVPLEDARNVLPLGINTRFTWSMNVSSLFHVLSKRTCWITQMGMWEPIVLGMIDELATKVDPMFRDLANPPCITKDDKFGSCPFKKENHEYLVGRDPHYPCPLYLYYEQMDAREFLSEPENNAVATFLPAPPEMVPVELRVRGVNWQPFRPYMGSTVSAIAVGMAERMDKFAKVWRHDPSAWRKNAVEAMAPRYLTQPLPSPEDRPASSGDGWHPANDCPRCGGEGEQASGRGYGERCEHPAHFLGEGFPASQSHFQPPPPIPAEAPRLKRPQTGWKCEHCLAINRPDMTECARCRMSRKELKTT